MSQIESFIVLDFETTGIEREARITEIAVIAVSREHILSAVTKAKGLPRVMNKFTICLKPDKPINPIAARISGLNENLLREQKPFDCTAFNILENFVCRFPQPVCLIAHNGDSYDFPILQAELEAFKQKLPDHVLCADSIKCFRALFSPKREPLDSLTIVEPSTVLEQNTAVEQSTALDLNLGAQVVVTDLKHSILSSSADNFNLTEVSFVQQVDATTVTYTRAKRRRSSVTVAGGRFSENSIIKQVSSPPRMPQSFKLVDIYKHLFHKKAQNNHTAHGDAQNLLQCIIATGEDFLSWTDKNARKLSDVKPRWSR